MTTTVGAHTFACATNLPNGVADGNNANDGQIVNFTVALGTPVTLTINTDCWGYETYWELDDAVPTTVYTGGNTSGIPPAEVVTTGSPAAIASNKETGHPSP